MEILFKCVLLTLLIGSCKSNTKSVKQIEPLTIDEHYRLASIMMCKCLEERVQDTAYKLTGALMNECESKSVREYLAKHYTHIKIDTANEAAVNEFSIGMIQSVNKDESSVLKVYKAHFWKNATKDEK